MLARSPGPYISTIKTSMARTVLGAGALWLHNYIHILILDIHQRVCVCVCTTNVNHWHAYGIDSM